MSEYWAAFILFFNIFVSLLSYWSLEQGHYFSALMFCCASFLICHKFVVLIRKEESA